ncbi:hypothetical protein Sjap_000077 [Stephania japonica]|uniref:Uncharacterized protein n=1 Tax=Stephania japonica TaxID=461633 RepID=A0AAP0KJP7_9MAGN
MMDITKLDRGQITYIGTGLCVLLTVHFSVKLLLQHLYHWKNPKEQKAIIVIILMAPLYAIVSYVGLVDFWGSKAFFTFLESIKECYEAFVIAKFLSLLYSYLNISISKNIVPDGIKGREIHHSFPMTLFQPHSVRLEHRTLNLLKNWTWQFVMIRPVCSLLMILLQMLGAYPSWVSWIFTIILNISVSLALYSLVVFYHVFQKELAPHKPLAKFLCIKGIVFFCFWQFYDESLLANVRHSSIHIPSCPWLQGLVLKVLVEMGVIRSHHFWLDVERIQEAYQNILVCIEMVIFSFIQQYAYAVTPYLAAGGSKSESDKKKE